jgi:hypothetical protein
MFDAFQALSPLGGAGSMLDVDVHSLEDFARSLETRLGEADELLAQIRAADTDLPLGTFPAARGEAQRYVSVQGRYEQAVVQLRESIVAAQQATQVVLSNYRTAEERNRATTLAIAEPLAQIADAVDRPVTNGGS